MPTSAWKAVAIAVSPGFVGFENGVMKLVLAHRTASVAGSSSTMPIVWSWLLKSVEYDSHTRPVTGSCHTSLSSPMSRRMLLAGVLLDGSGKPQPAGAANRENCPMMGGVEAVCSCRTGAHQHVRQEGLPAPAHEL